MIQRAHHIFTLGLIAVLLVACTGGPPDVPPPRRTGAGFPADRNEPVCRAESGGSFLGVTNDSSTVKLALDSCDGETRTSIRYGYVYTNRFGTTTLQTRFTHALTPTWRDGACFVDILQTTETKKLDEYHPAGAFPASVHLCRAFVEARFPEQLDPLHLHQVEVGADDDFVPLAPLDVPISLVPQANAYSVHCATGGPNADVDAFAYAYRATVSIPSDSLEAFSRARAVLHLDFITLAPGESGTGDEMAVP